jgi:hypothetical protein
MKRRSTSSPLRGVLLLAGLAVLLPMAVGTTACSVVGWGVGTALTRHSPPRVVPAGEAFELRPGTRMGVRLTDSTAMRGTFTGRIRLEQPVYAARFRAWRAQSGIALALGEGVEVTFRDRRSVRARFAGFAHRAVLLARSDGNGFDEVRESTVEWFGFGDSVGWTGDQLAEADSRGALPTIEAILFRRAPASAGSDWYNTGQSMWTQPERSTPGSITIAWDDLEAVEIEGPRHVRTALFLVGLAADAAIVVASQPTIAISSGGCAYESNSRYKMVDQPVVARTTLPYDTHWGAYVDGTAPGTQAFGESFLPSLPASPPAPMPSSAQKNSTTPTPAP